MTQKNTLTNYKEISADTIKWQQVLQFGTEYISKKEQRKNKKALEPAFIVLP